MHLHAQTSEAQPGEASGQTACPELNRLLAALPAAERLRLAPALQQVYLPLGQVLHESGEHLHYVHFPTDCIVSLVHVLNDEASSWISSVGNEGVVGVVLVMGGESTTNRAVVHRAGFAYRLPNARLQFELQRRGPLFNVLLRYTQALITQMAQLVVCNRHHSIDQQLCCWLLGSLDRQSSDKLTMTHENIARILGVRREGVSVAAGKLQKQGAISCARGRITVRDRSLLEKLACECYGAVKNETERLLSLRQNGASRSMT